jgi:cyclophilin family peptidyl-prolyl cis-trans isomerase
VNRNWPVRETWRASFILCACLSTVARAEAPSPTAAEAFALGQVGVAWEPPGEPERARAEVTLLAALAREQRAEVRDRIVEALGKVGGKAALAALGPLLDGAERARATIALATLAKNRNVSDTATRLRLEKLLGDSDAEVRYGAALALLRYKDPESRAALARTLADPAVHVRATAAKALADVGRGEDAPSLAPLLADGDVRVAAEAARTLVKWAMKCTAECPPLEVMRKARLPWRPSVVQAVTFEHWRGALAEPILRAAYEAAAGDAQLDRRTRAIVACQLAMGHDRAAGRLELLRRCGDRSIDERQRGVWTARALVDAGGAELAKLATSRHAAVRGVVAEGADAATTRLLLDDRDPAVVAAAAERASALKLADAAPKMQAALRRLRGPDAVEAQQAILACAAELRLTDFVPAARALVDAEPYALRQAAAHALTALEGKPVIARAPSLPPPPAPTAANAASSSAAPMVRLETTRGIIRARLWTADAPRTAANFVALVKRRFYDKLTFHRVVPNFVSQGGDPRGDGSGGPGYMIPCEINPRRYGEGVLGMALSGRDTGGSQFFFTHSPQPHLDGRYTAFGEIVEGLDVAARLIEGDVILRARVE